MRTLRFLALTLAALGLLLICGCGTADDEGEMALEETEDTSDEIRASDLPDAEPDEEEATESEPAEDVDLEEE